MGKKIPSPAQGDKTRSNKATAILLLAAIVGAGLWLTAHRRVRGQAAETDAATQAVKSVLPLESFVVNLADPDQSAFLRIGVDLALGQDVPKVKGDQKASPLIPKVRDVILSVLTTWQSGDLVAADGKTKLKQQLMNALRERVPELQVQEIYFTEFLVQR